MVNQMLVYSAGVEFQKKICGWMKEENKACLFADSIEDYTL